MHVKYGKVRSLQSIVAASSSDCEGLSIDASCLNAMSNNSVDSVELVSVRNIMKSLGNVSSIEARIALACSISRGLASPKVVSKRFVNSLIECLESNNGVYDDVLSDGCTQNELDIVNGDFGLSLGRLCLSLFACRRLVYLSEIAFSISCEVSQVYVGNIAHEIPPECSSTLKESLGNVMFMLTDSNMEKRKKKENTPEEFQNCIAVFGYARHLTDELFNSCFKHLLNNTPEAQLASLLDSCINMLLSALSMLLQSSYARQKSSEDITIPKISNEDSIDLVSSMLFTFSKTVSQVINAEITFGISTLLSRRPVPEDEKIKSEETSTKKNKKKKNKGGFILGKGILNLINVFENSPDKWIRILDCYSVKGHDEVLDFMTSLNTGRKPKLAKGTRDFGGEQSLVRERVFDVIKCIFKKHGGVGLDTPVFELRETLMGKYGEDSKLIYDLADQGGELLSLRYDLTVPFARYLAMNNVGNIKRYHIAKVYRRDNISVQKGRFREFYQCDFDIAGNYDVMLPDSEILVVLCEILDTLGIHSYRIKLSDRRLLTGMLGVCGVPDELFTGICSAIDKLDKNTWEQVRVEMIEKGLEPKVADRIYPYTKITGSPFEILEQLEKDKELVQHSLIPDTLEELKKLFGYLESMRVLDKVLFDTSLARGLNYYTGVIYEAILTDGVSKVGSIAAGGRYDNLVGIFCNRQIPAVGVSIGIERIFNIVMDIEKKNAESMNSGLRPVVTQVLVASIGPNLTNERLKLCSELWEYGIATETLYLETPTTKKQIAHAIKTFIPHVVFIGQDEIANGVVNLKDIQAETQEQIQRDQIGIVLREKLMLNK